MGSAPTRSVKLWARAGFVDIVGFVMGILVARAGGRYKRKDKRTYRSEP